MQWKHDACTHSNTADSSIAGITSLQLQQQQQQHWAAPQLVAQLCLKKDGTRVK